jgi:hypothetical protein
MNTVPRRAADAIYRPTPNCAPYQVCEPRAITRADPILGETLFALCNQIAALWLVSARISTEALALSLRPLFPSVGQQSAPNLSVQVEYDPEAKVYWCHCEDIGLLTEASTLDDLVDIARELGPDIATDYGYNISPDALTFVVH